MFHRHKWKITKQEEQPSSIELMRQAGVTNFKGGWPESWESLSRRPIIVTRVCELCGTEEVVRI